MRSHLIAATEPAPSRRSRATTLPMYPVTPKTEEVNPYIRVIYRAVSLLRDAQRHAQAGFCDDPRALDLFITAIRAFHELTSNPRATALTDGIEKRHGDEKSLMVLIGNNIKDINAMDSLGRTPLVLAVEYGARLGLVTCLLNAGASPNQADARGCTPLALAARRGDKPLISMLIDHGASSCVPGWAPPGTLSPLEQAAQNNRADVMELLYNFLAAESASVKQMDLEVEERFVPSFLRPSADRRPWIYSVGLTALRTVTEWVSPERRQRLLNTQGAQALLQAAEQGNWKSVQFLSEAKGLVLDAACLDEALARVCRSPVAGAHDHEIVQLLYGKSKNPVPHDVIESAVKFGKTKVVEFLWANADHALWTKEDAKGILRVAIENGDAELFALVWLRAEPCLAIPPKEDLTTRTTVAAARGHLEAVRALIQYRPIAEWLSVDARELVAEALRGGNPAVYKLVWPSVSQRMEPGDLQYLLKTAALARNRLVAEALFLDAGVRPRDLWDWVPLLSLGISLEGTGFLNSVALAMAADVKDKNNCDGDRNELLNFAVRQTDRKAARHAIDIVLGIPGFVPDALTVIEPLDLPGQRVPETMRYLLSHPACVLMNARAAEKEISGGRPVWSVLAMYFDEPEQIGKIAAQALSGARSVGAFQLLLGYGAAAYLDKGAVFNHLKHACKTGRFQFVPVLLNSEAGRNLSRQECSELWELAVGTAEDRHRYLRSLSGPREGLPDELRQRATGEEALT